MKNFLSHYIKFEEGDFENAKPTGEESLLLAKIQKLHIFFSLVFTDMTSEEKEYLDEKDVLALEHLILSHHGPVALGFGSAVSPKTPEAVALYRLDELSAQVNGVLWGKDAKPR